MKSKETARVGKGTKSVSSTSVSKRGRKKYTKTADSSLTIDETFSRPHTSDIPSTELTMELPLQPEQCANIVVGPSHSSMPPTDIHSQVENSMNSSRRRSRSRTRIISENLTMTTRSRSKSETTQNIDVSRPHESHFIELSETASHIDKRENVGRTKQPRSNPGKSKQKHARKTKESVLKDIDVLPKSVAAPQIKSGELMGNNPITLTDSISINTSCLEGSTRNKVTHQNDDYTSHRTNRKRRSSLESSEDRQRISPTTRLKGILVNSTHLDLDMVGPSGIFKDACSPHRTDQTHISKRPRIEFKSGHDTRYFKPDFRKVKSRRHNGEHDLRITVLKKNASQAMSPIRNSSGSGARNSQSADSSLPSIHSEGGDGSRLMDRAPTKKHPIITTLKRQHLPHEERSAVQLHGNTWATGEIGLNECSINFDSLTVMNSLIDFIIDKKEVGGQVVEMILSRDNVNCIFLEKMIKSKDFGQRLTNVLSAFPDYINLDDLTSHLLSEIVKQNSEHFLRNDEGEESTSLSIPDCVWRKGLGFLKEVVTEGLQSTDSCHSMASQPCSLGPSGVCANHQKPKSGPNISNSSILPAVFDLETQILQRVVSKIVESNPDTLKNFHEKSQDDILNKFRSVSVFLKEMTAQALSEDIRKEANTIFKSLAERMILGTPDCGNNLNSN